MTEIDYPNKIHPNQSLLYFDAASDRTLIFVHGGAWISGKKSQFQFIPDYFTTKNYNVALIGYRLTDKKQETRNVYPDPVDDVATGIKLIIDKFPDHKLFVVGHSCGAQLSGLVCLTDRYLKLSQIKIVVGVEGIYDIPSLASVHPDWIDWFIGWQFPDKTKWDEASPLQQATVPIKYGIVYSLDDEYKMQDQSLNMKQKMLEIGAQVKYDESLGGSHDGILTQENLYKLLLEWFDDAL
ncbi:Alpha/Beta hydrolase protein [Gorgonomyces haynaldii]|nr:Alpha/Beta hydrolase protein [Gorgonomyces haynaldii]